MSLLPLTYAVGLLLTLFMGLKILSCVTMRGRASFEKYPYSHLALIGLVVGFWFAPWGAPLGSMAAKMDSGHRFSLYNSPFSAREFEAQKAYTRILQDRYGIYCAIPSCLAFTKRDIYFENVYDNTMRAAILKHYGRDVLAECEQAARDETGTPKS